ncbi:MAG: DNA-3-methyladenine glycosylase family protein [Magnetovibrionaceae bacterium]
MDQKALTEAISFLCDRDPVLAYLHRRVGTPAVRRLTPDFGGLARIVVDQVVSVAAGAALWKRLEIASETEARPLRSLDIVRLGPAGLRACGLSGGKCRTLMGLAAAEADGRLDFEALTVQSDEQAVKDLCGLHGVGPWTAEVFLMFGLGRPDVWPAGDLALRIAVERFFAQPERPSIKQMREISEQWKPHRSAAALLLWKAYSHDRPSTKRSR